MNKRQVGNDKEQLATDYLASKGMRILEKNFRERQGEIDIVGFHEEYLVFVEVKYRANAFMGGPLSAVDLKKQRKICQVADYYRIRHKISAGTAVRYDVVGIQGNEIQWIQNAFPHVYSRY